MDFSDAFSPKDPLAKDIQSIFEATDKLRQDILGYLFIHNKSEYQDIADFLHTGTREVAQIARELDREGLVKTSTTWMVLTPKGKKSLTEESVQEASVGDKHQKKIAIDTVKNPMKGKLLGGMSEKEAINILKTKFGYTDTQIKKLQKEEINEAKMSDSEILSAAKALAKNGKDEKAKKFGQGLVDFYKKNKSFTPDQVSGLQNIMKNASFQLAKEDVNEAAASPPGRFFGQPSEIFYIRPEYKDAVIAYFDREHETFRMYQAQNGFAVEVAEDDVDFILPDLRKMGIRPSLKGRMLSNQPMNLKSPDQALKSWRAANEETERTWNLSEARLSLNQMNKIDSLLYAIMTDDKSKLNDWRTGNPPAGYMKNVVNNLRRNFKDVEDREIPIVVDMAIQNGYVQKDGDILRITPKAQDYIRYMES